MFVESDISLFFESLLLVLPAVGGIVCSVLLAAFGAGFLRKRSFMARVGGAALTIFGIVMGGVIGFYLIFAAAMFL